MHSNISGDGDMKYYVRRQPDLVPLVCNLPEFWCRWCFQEKYSVEREEDGATQSWHWDTKWAVPVASFSRSQNLRCHGKLGSTLKLPSFLEKSCMVQLNTAAGWGSVPSAVEGALVEQGRPQPAAEVLGGCWDAGVRNAGEAVRNLTARRDWKSLAGLEPNPGRPPTLPQLTDSLQQERAVGYNLSNNHQNSSVFNDGM